MKRDRIDQSQEKFNLKNGTKEYLEISSTGYGLESAVTETKHNPNLLNAEKKNSSACGGL